MFDDLKQNSASNDPASNTAPSPKASESVGEPAMENVKSTTKPTPKPVDDMFGDIDPVAPKASALQSGKIQSVSQTADPNTGLVADLQIENVAAKDDKARIKKIAAMVISIMLLAAIATVVYAYFFAGQEDTELPIEETVPVEEEVTEPVEEEAKPPVEEKITKPPVEEEIVDKGQLDYDGDSLSNAEEDALGTDPLEPDTDNDGVFDWDEVKLHESNPLEPDTDGDELGDYDEIYVWGTDPIDIDTDGDGYGDGVEVNGGYNPYGEGDMDDFVPPDQRITE